MDKDKLIEYLESCAARYERISEESYIQEELCDMNFYDGKVLALREAVQYIKYYAK